MSRKNETPVLILSLLITLALIGGGLWFLARQVFNPGGSSGGPSVEFPTGGSSSQSSADRFSTGDKLIIPEGASPEKQAGVAAIAAKDYNQAITSLEASLQAERNDPEALIYLNNARIGDQKSYILAICVPKDTTVESSLELLRGVAQAQDEINRSDGKIEGVPLKVLIVNDGNTPDTARQVAAELVKMPEVLGVVGHFSSDVSLAAGEVYEKAGLVAISPSSTSVKLSNFGRYIFRTVPSDYVAARALANYAEKVQKQQTAVFYNSQSAYSQSLKSEFTTAIGLGGGEVVGEFDFNDSGFDPVKSVQEATERRATALVLLPNSGKLEQAMAVLKANDRKLSVLAGDAVYSPKTLEQGEEAANSLVVAVPWHILTNEQTPFVNSSRALWGGDVNWRTAMAYDATIALAEALKRNPTRQGVQQALADRSFSAPGGTGAVRFLPSGDRNQAVQLVVAEPGDRSGYGYDFVPVR
jgi:branched-chain amino acid transport system substrate-binding protein